MEDNLLLRATELFRKAKADFDARDFTAAEKALEASIDILQTQFGSDHPQTDQARVLLEDATELIADCQFGGQKYDLCAQNYQALLARAAFRDAATKVRLRFKLAKTYEQQQKRAEALSFYEEAADLCDRNMPVGTLLAALTMEGYFKLLKDDGRAASFVSIIAEKARRARTGVVADPSDNDLAVFGRALVTQEMQELKHHIDSMKHIPEAGPKPNPLATIARISLSLIVVVGAVIWISRLNTNLAKAPEGGGGGAATLIGRSFQCPGVDGAISFPEAGNAQVTSGTRQHKLVCRNAGGLQDLLHTIIHGNSDEWWISPQDTYFFDSNGQIFYASDAPELLVYNSMKDVSERVTKETQLNELDYENPFSHEKEKLDAQPVRTPVQFVDDSERLLRMSGVSEQPLPLSIALYGYSDPDEYASTEKEFQADYADLLDSFPSDKEKLQQLRSLDVKKTMEILKTPGTIRVTHVPGTIIFGESDSTRGYGSDGKELPYYIVKGVKSWKWVGPIKRSRFTDITSGASFVIMQAVPSAPPSLPDRSDVVIANWTRAQIADANGRRHWTPIWFYLSLAGLLLYFALVYRSNDLLNHGLFISLVCIYICASTMIVQPYEKYFYYAVGVTVALWVLSGFRKGKV